MNVNAFYKNHHDVIIIGGGQAGLAMGYQLKIRSKEFLILDANETIGGKWSSRWDSLQLFTPKWAVKYPGHDFPKIRGTYPDKNDMVNFLQSFVHKYQLPVLTNMKVNRVEKTGQGYKVITPGREFTCRNIVVASGNYAEPKIPSFSKQLSDKIVQLHSSEYKNPALLPPGNILVVGAGTSGLQIALDIAKTGKKVFVSGTPPPRIPPVMLKYFGRPMIWMMNNRMTIKTKAGRKMRDAIKINGQAAPLININLKQVTDAGVMHLPKVAGSNAGYPLLTNGNKCDVSVVIWCTGFTRDFSWLQNMEEIIDDHGYPITERGVVKDYKGLYFLGMAFQYAITSTWILGVGRDAAYIADHIQKNTVREIF